MKACRTCLQTLEAGTVAIKLFDIFCDGTPEKNPIPIKDKLADYIPEFSLGSELDTFLCHPCAAAITGAYRFKQKCLETQKKIRDYLEQKPVGTQMNIEDVALHYGPMEVVATGENPTVIGVESKDVTIVVNDVKDESLSANEGKVARKAKDSTVDKKRKPSSDEGEEPSQYPCVEKDVIELSEPELNSQEVYKCTLCKNLLSSYSRFCYHMLLHNNQNTTIKCSKCGFTCSHNRELAYHMKKHKIIYRELCHLCDCRFPDKTELTIHMKSHADLGILFRCKFCNFHFDEQITLKLHLESHRKYHKFECDICASSFPSRRKLKVHYWTHISHTKTFLNNTKIVQKGIKRAHNHENVSRRDVPVKRRRDSRSQVNGKSSKKD